MKTDDLIACLAVDAPSTSTGRIRRDVALMAAGATVIAFAAVIATLGVRPDLAQAMAGQVFWAKAVYTAAVALASVWLLDRAGRPGADPRPALTIVVILTAVAATAALGQLASAPDTERMGILMGGSGRVCSINIAGLSALTAPLLILAGRRFAPTRPALAGAAIGLFAGAIAATVYGLHCPERTATFVGVWYSLGMLIPAAIGALAGRLIWRW